MNHRPRRWLDIRQELLDAEFSDGRDNWIDSTSDLLSSFRNSRPLSDADKQRAQITETELTRRLNEKARARVKEKDNVFDFETRARANGHTAPGGKPNGQDHGKREQTSASLSLDEWDAGTDPGPIQPREWLLANQFCRRFISSIVGVGGTGKSALRLLQFISLATGRPLSGQHVFRRCRVLLISLEDDRDELQRRITAALIRYGIDRSELKGWLFCAAPKLSKIAELNNNSKSAGPLEQQIKDAIARCNPDLISLDPFIKSHALEENNSGDMDFVCSLLARMAVEFNVAVDSPHHAHKGQVVPGSADAGRGSSGIRDAARLVYTLSTMGEEEAAALNVPAGERGLYIRLDSSKVNIAARSTTATWFKLIGMPLGNATEEYPAGDMVQTVEPWTPPGAFDGVTEQAANAILDVVDAGLCDDDGRPNGHRYSNGPNVKERAAWKIVQRFAPDKGEKLCRSMITSWLKNGTLVVKSYKDPKHYKECEGLFVDNSKRPGQPVPDDLE